MKPIRFQRAMALREKMANGSFWYNCFNCKMMHETKEEVLKCYNDSESSGGVVSKDSTSLETLPEAEKTISHNCFNNDHDFCGSNGNSCGCDCHKEDV